MSEVLPAVISQNLEQILRLHGENETIANKWGENAFEIGRLLCEVKESLNYGEWIPWVEANLPFTRQHAARYMRMFQDKDLLPDGVGVKQATLILSERATIQMEHGVPFEEPEIEAMEWDIPQPAAPAPPDYSEQAFLFKLGFDVDLNLVSETTRRKFIDGDIGREQVKTRINNLKAVESWGGKYSIESGIATCPTCSNAFDLYSGWDIKQSGKCPYCFKLQYAYKPEPPARIELPEPRAHVSNNSGNNEWYTPSEYIESARLVMGSIDLDPASSDIANEAIRAEMYYTAETDGLSQQWYGNIWMNPPYAQPLITQFIEKLCSEPIEQAIVLVNNATETAWGSMLLQNASAVCFPKGRIRFVAPDGRLGDSPLQGQMIAYIGAATQTFISEFKKYGVCLLSEV